MLVSGLVFTTIPSWTRADRDRYGDLFGQRKLSIKEQHHRIGQIDQFGQRAVKGLTHGRNRQLSLPGAARARLYVVGIEELEDLVSVALVVAFLVDF